MTDEKPTLYHSSDQNMRAVSNPRFRYLFLFAVGLVLFGLGMAMVTPVHTWMIFSVWSPLVLICIGLLLLGSKTYSPAMALTFFLIGGFLWLHQAGIYYVPYLTLFVDWLFVFVGIAVMGIAAARLLVR